MPGLLIPFLSGLLFGVGLVVSHMVDPAKVLGFLDVFGNWDPSLAFVMLGAILVAAPAFALARRMDRPFAATRFEIPARTTIDAPLLGGAVLFGVGWGLAGLCPGPALAALTLKPGPVLPFLASMLGGMVLFELTAQARARALQPKRDA